MTTTRPPTSSATWCRWFSTACGYRAECTCGWAGPWSDDAATADDQAVDHWEVAVDPPDAMDAAMSAMLDLQDDLAEVVMWLAENWSTDLPSPYLHGIDHDDLADDRHRAGVRLLMPCPDAEQLARAAERLGVPVRTDTEPNSQGDRYARALRRFGRVEVEVYRGVGVVVVTPFYDDGQVTLYCADFRGVDVAAGSVAAVVTSPPYNVGLDYEATSDVLAWPEYWALAADAAAVMAGVLVEGGRAWVNTAVSVPADLHPLRGGKARVMLAHRWAGVVEAAGLALVDQVAWCSPRGAGTAWGSWESPGGPESARRLGIDPRRLRWGLGADRAGGV